VCSSDLVEFRESDPETAVVLREADAAAWHLRHISYSLAANRSANGSYPLQLPTPAATNGGPERRQHWPWPPAYWSDGARYTLTLDIGPEKVQLTEDGLLQRLFED